MGQYHHVVNMTARGYLDPYPVGCGLKAWEQSGGGVPAVLTALLSDKPGNMPADLGSHPMVGRWAGHRLLVVGDYAEDKDIPKFEGTPLSKIYGLCGEAPKLSDYMPYEEVKNGKRTMLTAAKQLAEANRRWTRLTSRHPAFENVTPQIVGIVEQALSVRYIGEHWKCGVPVKPFAERGKDGHLHYVLSNSVTRKPKKDEYDMLAYIWRVCGFGGRHGDAAPDPTKLPFGLDRWPWDRPPADLSWHNTTDAMADEGQTRVFANLDRREFIDPAKFGEQPTTAGIMRAADCAEPRLAMDMVISSKGVQSNTKDGDRDFGSAGAVFAMLLHPEPRGGGDISAKDFPEVGRWRNNRLVLTSEFATELPSTDEVKRCFTDISGKVIQSLAVLAAA